MTRETLTIHYAPTFKGATFFLYPIPEKKPWANNISLSWEGDLNELRKGPLKESIDRALKSACRLLTVGVMTDEEFEIASKNIEFIKFEIK
jgi:hypothetical protein